MNTAAAALSRHPDMIVGMDPEAVAGEVRKLRSRSTRSLLPSRSRFLSLLQNHIARYGTIEVERLYDAPFTVIDADGPDGVFEKEGDLSDLIDIVRSFGSRPQERTEA